MDSLTREDLARLRELMVAAEECPCDRHADDRETFAVPRLRALIALAERALDAEEGETRVETMWRRKSDGEQLKSPTYNKRASEPYKRTVTYGPWRPVDKKQEEAG